MLNTFLRATNKSWSHCILVAQCEKIVQRLASFTPRHIIQENCGETGTLLARFAKHIAIEMQRVTPIVPTTIRYPDFLPITNMYYLKKELNSIPPDQLPTLITFAFTYRPSADPVKFAALLNELDRVALQRLPDMDEDTVLRTLYSLLYLIPNWITRTDFYYAATHRLATKHFTPDSGKEKFMQLCFYLGLEKNRAISGRSGELLQQMLDKHLEFFLPDLSTMDVAVIANAAYKTSTRINCVSYNLRLEEEVNKLAVPSAVDDYALMVTFIKSMRLQRVNSPSMCERLAEHYAEADILRKLQPRGLVHIFAYFAENRWDEINCVSSLSAQFMHSLEHPQDVGTRDGEFVRCKDLATFLWCCSQLKCHPTANQLKTIESVLLKKVHNDEFQYFADQLVDSCLSLWMLGMKSQNLIEAAIELKSYSKAKSAQREQPKVDSRLVTLLTAAAIEEPTWKLKTNIKIAQPFNMDAIAPAYLLKERNDLTKFTQMLAAEDDTLAAKIVCPINGINIPSILVHCSKSKRQTFVELLTPKQELIFSKLPIGLLSLKTQLLEALGHKVVVLRPAQWSNNNISVKELIFSAETDDQPKVASVESI